MEIVWYGFSCFRIMERGLASVITDPYGPELGLPSLKLKADIVTMSHDDPGHNYVKAVKGCRRVIASPGEYEIGGVFITAISMWKSNKKTEENHESTVFVFDFNGVSVAHLGSLSHVPPQAQIEDLGAVDIALVPVGGGGALSSTQASEVISLIEPSLVIPMQYKSSTESPRIGTITRFLKEMGIESEEPVPVLRVSRSSLSEETQVVLLKPSI
jgi:L-ascorbate metabolism protein UlaG (beta-lactamase superfamily)